MRRAGLVVCVLFALPLIAQSVSHELPLSVRILDAIVFTPDGSGWVSTPPYGVYRIDADGTVTKAASDFLTKLAVGSDGAVWGYTGVPEQLVRIDPATGAVQRFDIAPGLVNAFAAGPDGMLWLVLSGQTLLRYDTSGRLVSTSVIVPALSPNVITVNMVAAGGFMWTVDDYPHTPDLVRFDASGATQRFPMDLRPEWAYWLLSGGDFLWIVTDANEAARSIVKVSLDGAILARHPAPVISVGATTDAEGNLWLSDQNTQVIVRMTPDGEVRTVATVRHEHNCCAVPDPMAVAPDGRVAVGKAVWADLLSECRDEKAFVTLFDPDASRHRSGRSRPPARTRKRPEAHP